MLNGCEVWEQITQYKQQSIQFSRQLVANATINERTSPTPIIHRDASTLLFFAGDNSMQLCLVRLRAIHTAHPNNNDMVVEPRTDRPTGGWITNL